jgi:probable HAF family extracellular repeat protein
LQARLFRPRLEALEDRLVPTYTITDLGSLGGAVSVATSINDRNEIVGYSNLPNDAFTHAFTYRNGTMLDIGTLGGTVSEAFGVNFQGEVVGYSRLAGDQFTHAFLDQNGKMSDLGTLGGTYSVASGLNDSGQIVGYASLPGEQSTHAFLYQNGSMTDLGTLGGNFSSAFGINSSGEVVGDSTLAGDQIYHAFSWKAGVMTDLGTLGGPNSEAMAVNSAGSSVGDAFTSPNNRDAFLDKNGTMTDLGNLGAGFSFGLGINLAGVVVGYADTPGKPDTHAFVVYNGIQMQDLNNLIPPNSGSDLQRANAISDLGVIVGTGITPGRQTRAFALIPSSGTDAAGDAGASLAAAIAVHHVSQPSLPATAPATGSLEQGTGWQKMTAGTSVGHSGAVTSANGEHRIGALTTLALAGELTELALPDPLASPWEVF